MNINDIIQKHKLNWQDDNFEGWKTTEIMYCKIGWLVDGSDDLIEHLEIILLIRDFIEDLQKIEANEIT